MLSNREFLSRSKKTVSQRKVLPLEKVTAVSLDGSTVQCFVGTTVRSFA